MKLKKLLDYYDNWNGITKINDDDLNPLFMAKTYILGCNEYHAYDDLLNKKVVSFGFYDDYMSVRVK